MTVITLPPDIDALLTAEARRRGTTPERLALDTLRRSLDANGPIPAAIPGNPAGDPAQIDPVVAHIGAIQSKIDDWTCRHDEYLAEELLNESKIGDE
jgi:hypothetical protein